MQVISLCIVSCHLQTVTVLLLLFRFGFLLFFFSSLIAVAKTSKTMLNNTGESGQPCLVPDLRGNAFSCSPLKWCLLWVCHIWPLLCWGKFALCPLSGGFLSYMGVEFCQKFSLHLLRLSCGFYSSIVNVVYHIDWFAYIEESLHPWDKSHLIMVYDPFNVLLDSVS